MFFFYFIVLLSAVPNHPWFGEQVNGLTLIKYLGILCLLYTIYYLAARRPNINLFHTWPDRLFILLFILVLGSKLLTLDSTGSLGGSFFTIYLSVCLLFFTTRCLITSFPRFVHAILALIGALVLASAYSLREYQIAGFSTYRPGWVAGDANLFAAATLLAMPLAYHWMMVTRSFKERWFCAGALLVVFAAFVVSGSRGAFVGLCATSITMFLRSRHKFRLVMTGLLLVPLLVFAPTSPIKRIVAPEYGDIASTSAHETLWRFGVQMALEHPLAGIGLGNFKPMTVRYHILEHAAAVGHNSYIEMATELGVFGFLAFVGIIASTLVLLEKIQKRASQIRDKYLAALSAGLQEGLIGFAVAAFFFSAQYEKPLWIAIFLSSALFGIAQRSTSARGASVANGNRARTFAVEKPKAAV